MSGSLKSKSDKCWELADELRVRCDFNNCASRVYYSVFQAVVFYAIKKEGYDPEKAQHLKRNVHNEMRNIVMNKLFALKDIYEDMRLLRNTADYDPDDVNATDLENHTWNSMQTIRDFFLKEAEK